MPVQAPVLKRYGVGDYDIRPWGEYLVTAVQLNEKSEGFIEKRIIIRSGRIISLQSHTYRREVWTINQGSLIVILNEKRHELKAGDRLEIPMGAIHCAANMGLADCVLHERQEGQCFEGDIMRHMDAYGREVETPPRANALESIVLFNGTLAQMRRRS